MNGKSKFLESDAQKKRIHHDSVTTNAFISIIQLKSFPGKYKELCRMSLCHIYLFQLSVLQQIPD